MSYIEVEFPTYCAQCSNSSLTGVILLQFILTIKLNCDVIMNNALLSSETHGTSDPTTVTRPHDRPNTADWAAGADAMR